jgi:hypothetical protein
MYARMFDLANETWFMKGASKMINHISILRELAMLVALASIFTILVVTILKLLRRAAFFQGTTAVIMAVSLSLLFLVVLSQSLAVPGEAYYATGSGSEENAATDYFPLPGIALAVAAAVVLSQVLLLASKTSPDEKPGPLARKPERTVKPKSPGRAKKEKSAEEESEEAPKPVGSAS